MVCLPPLPVPGPPEELHVERVGETTLALEWKRPQHPNGILTGYLLQYRQGPLLGALGGTGGGWEHRPGSRGAGSTGRRYWDC